MASLSSMFFDQARARPDKLALSCEGTSLSYGALARIVLRWSAALVGRGLRRGDAVGVVLPNSAEFVALMLVAADLGLVLVPLSPSLGAAAMRRAFAATGVRHVVATDDVLETLGDGVPGLRLAVEGLDALLAEAGPEDGPFGWGRGEDAFILTMTSGSTGDPKPIVLTQDSKRQRALAAIGMYGVTPDDVTLAATPLYHSLAERLVLIPLLGGGTSILMARFSAGEWLEAVRRHRVSFTIAVSSQLGQIARALERAAAPDSLRCVVSSSALLEPPVKDVLCARLACELHECYGTSEIAIATTLDMQAGRAKRSSVGRAALGVDLVLLGEDGRPVEAGEVGEIAARTPMLFGGYYRRPELTAAAMWGEHFRTGDLGRLDRDGFLYFVGRKKEIIITGGINVYPADIEAALAGYPGLKEAAAFAVPDAALGEVVGLAYVPDAPAGFDLRRLRHHCARELADFQQPRRFLALDALPRNAMGKLTRHALAGLLERAEEACPA